MVDDDPAILRLLQLWGQSWDLPVECYDSAEAFLAAEAMNRPGCLLLDVNMKGMSGLELQAQLTAWNVVIPIIIITGSPEVPVAVTAMKLQAIDYIQKPIHKEHLRSLIDHALAQDALRRLRRHDRDVVLDRLNRLSARERQVMDLVVQGLANKQVAARLELSEKTVEIHRGRVMQKTEAGSLAELVRMAITAESNEQAHGPLESPAPHSAPRHH